MGQGESSDMGHWLFLKSTCDTAPPPGSRAPLDELIMESSMLVERSGANTIPKGAHAGNQWDFLPQPRSG